LALGLEKKKRKISKKKKKKKKRKESFWKLLLSADVKRDVNKRCDKKITNMSNLTFLVDFKNYKC
jgi:hypothetical protein